MGRRRKGEFRGTKRPTRRSPGGPGHRGAPRRVEGDHLRPAALLSVPTTLRPACRGLPPPPALQRPQRRPPGHGRRGARRRCCARAAPSRHWRRRHWPDFNFDFFNLIPSSKPVTRTVSTLARRQFSPARQQSSFPLALGMESGVAACDLPRGADPLQGAVGVAVVGVVALRLPRRAY